MAPEMPAMKVFRVEVLPMRVLLLPWPVAPWPMTISLVTGVPDVPTPEGAVPWPR